MCCVCLMTSEVFNIVACKSPTALSLFFFKNEVASCSVDPSAAACLMFDV